jgi:hypothetical protein
VILPVRLMSQTSGVAKKRPGNVPSMPTLTERIEHSLSVVAVSGETRNAVISEANPSLALDHLPLSGTITPRAKHRTRNPRYRSGLETMDLPRRRLDAMGRWTDEVTLGSPALGREVELARNWYYLLQIHGGETLDATFDGSVDAGRDKNKQPAGSEKETRRRLDDTQRRVKAREKQYQCVGCRQPITGNRYECQGSDRFNLCQDCFTYPKKKTH